MDNTWTGSSPRGWARPAVTACHSSAETRTSPPSGPIEFRATPSAPTIGRSCAGGTCRIASAFTTTRPKNSAGEDRDADQDGGGDLDAARSVVQEPAAEQQ